MSKNKVLKIRKPKTDSWESSMQQFLYWKQAQGLRQRTVEDYQKHISLFFNRYPTTFEDDTMLKTSVYEYMAQNIKPATFNLRLVYLRAFFDWCLREGLLNNNPLLGFKRKRAEGRVVNLDTEILAKLIALPDKSTVAGLRDYSIILLTLDSGIRPKEAFSLLISDINLRALEVYIRSDVSKTKISRTLPILPVTAMAIKDLTAQRHSAWKDTIPVFCTTGGNPMDSFMWNDRLEVYSKKLGVKIRPYDLRHAFALQFLRNGGHALALQRTLGHSDLSMTKRYVALTEQDLIEQHTLASPLNTLIPSKNRVRKIK